MGADRRLLSIAVALGMFLALRLAPHDSNLGSVMLIGATLAGSGAFIVLLGRRAGGAIALLVSAALNRYTADFAGITLKPEHIAAPLVALALLPDLRQLVRRVDLPSGLLLAWLGWSIIGALNAPDPGNSARLWVMLLLVAFPYFVVVTITGAAARLRLLTESWLLVGIGVGLFGVLVHLAFAWGVDLGIQVNPVTFDPTVPSTFREANLFGSAMMMLTLAAMGLVAFGARTSRLTWVAIIVGLLGLQVSFTRTAWLAFVAGVLLLAALKGLAMLRAPSGDAPPATAWRPLALTVALVFLGTALLWSPIGDDTAREEREQRGREREQARATSAAQAAVATPTPFATLPMLITPVATPEFTVPTADPQNPDIVGRVGSFGDVGSDSSVRIRIEFAKQAVKDWRAHPIVGQGIGSFGQKYITSSADRAWLSNVFVRVLHDSGIIGLALFTAPLALFAVRTLRIAWRRPVSELEILALSLGVAIAGMFIAFQATEGLQIAWYWWSLGLFAAALRLTAQPDTP